MLNRVSKFIERHHLLSASGIHLVALSGGADSVALLRILLSLGYHVEAVHCNFHLRGDESEHDEYFVNKLCRQLDVSLHLIHFDTREYASLHKVSLEMAARELRYGYFNRLLHDIGAETICVAHHRDDTVETVLMNLVRGTGIHGLTGIRPKNGDVVRPLLCVSRKNIEEYLHSIGQDYVVDSTNLIDNVLRNKIRLRVMPLLKEISPHAADSIDKTATYMYEAEKIFNKAMMDVLPALIKRESASQRELVVVSDLYKQPSPEILLHEWLSPYGFNASQIEQILSHLDGGTGRVFATASHTLVIDRDSLILEPFREPMKPINIPEEGCYILTENLKLNAEVVRNVPTSKSDNCITLDKDKVLFPLQARLIMPGDSFYPFGMKSRKLVSDFLTDQKVSLLDRRQQLVVTDSEGNIIWLVGRRTDNRFRVTEQTTSILRITLVKTP